MKISDKTVEMILMLGVFFAAVTLCSLRHKDHGQHTENERLNDTHEQFEHHDHGRQDRDLSQQTSHNCHQHDPREHVTEKTEGKRKDLRDFRDQLKQADQKIHRAKERHFEHAACVKELTQIAKSLCAETDHLDHHHRDQSQRRGEVQIH